MRGRNGETSLLPSVLRAAKIARPKAASGAEAGGPGRRSLTRGKPGEAEAEARGMKGRSLGWVEPGEAEAEASGTKGRSLR